MYLHYANIVLDQQKGETGMVIKWIKHIFTIVILSSMVTTAFAEDAPVYDVDNYPPQFGGQPDLGSTSGVAAAPQAVPEGPSDIAVPQQRGMPQSLTIDQRMNRVEQQMTNLQHSDSSSRLSALQNEVQSLRGQVEELTHQLQQMQSQQRSMYSDLDKRINSKQVVAKVTPQTAETDNAAITPLKTRPKKTAAKKSKTLLSAAPIPAADEPAADDQAVVPPKPTPAIKPVAQAKSDPSPHAEQEELQLYQNAYDLIKESKFDQAIGVLQNMLKKYPSGQSAANAHYWLGELYGLQKKSDQAAIEFATVVNNYPDSPKVSDAEVKLGMIYAGQFKWPEAKSTFKKVMTRYPGTTSARLAAQQLKEIKAGGH